MTHAIRFHKAGGPEVLQWEEVQVGKPGPGEARVRNTAVGLNYVDTYHRSGLYPLSLPSGLGSEGGRASSRRSARASPTSRRAIASPMAAGRWAPTPRARHAGRPAGRRCPTASAISRRRDDAEGPDRRST